MCHLFPVRTQSQQRLNIRGMYHPCNSRKKAKGKPTTFLASIKYRQANSSISQRKYPKPKQTKTASILIHGKRNGMGRRSLTTAKERDVAKTASDVRIRNVLGNDLEYSVCHNQYSRGKGDCMENKFIQDNMRDHDEGEER